MGYACSRCGRKVKLIDQFIRCTYCGSRVLIKERPNIAREISTD